ncbi:aminodeoxychorismate synthase component I [Volucribacter amazonae]|uniref:Aminodeoxychorismate synthase component I n=1 Tax=Volucribacter amazonae TaxID=256731 RepID=A0A9X4PB53_9PAST|nr:aminodeoxychorismate synthase component I [Volucribacter amazonae]MDG6895833.1 aminodeoxychorismate synthase component I [Volucribacter amazonae]
MIKPPYFFLIDFEQQAPLIVPCEQAHQQGIYFDIQGYHNLDWQVQIPTPVRFSKTPLDYYTYQQGFQQVQQQLQFGNTYLLNLTYPTAIETNLNLRQLFQASQAPYKLLWDNRFVCFSPECFVKMENDRIYTYPMKGTIDAELPQAKEQLLHNEKEIREHNTIVDLMRNDLAIIAQNIQVDRYRYLEKIERQQGAIWQTSSQISGELPANWQQDPLSLLQKLLPAGSISGAPKQKTVQIIQQAEQQKRGYYTGVFGYFDGQRLISAVAIRYIAQQGQQRYFHSGGGITAQSEVNSEYDELCEKVYLPLKTDYR